jgi:ankyrin repeat protein
VEQGADVEARGEDGWTALHRAARYGHEAVVRLLVEQGADVEAWDRDGWTALYHAVENGHEAVVRLLQSAARS